MSDAKEKFDRKAVELEILRRLAAGERLEGLRDKNELYVMKDLKERGLAEGGWYADGGGGIGGVILVDITLDGREYLERTGTFPGRLRHFVGEHWKGIVVWVIGIATTILLALLGFG